MFKSEISINGKLTLKNRLVMPPMATGKSGKDGGVTDRLCDYYDEKSKGGYIGLIITEHCYISPEGRAHDGQVSICRDEDIEGLKKLTEAIHANGTPVFAQISHAGIIARPEEGYEAAGPSAVHMPRRKESEPLALEMSADDIGRLKENFAAAALRAKKAGFDGIELHTAHGYLLNQFYSPLTNKRADEYTGSTIDGRIRLHCEVIRAVRAAVGEDYPIAVRFGACDYTDGGSTKEDALLAVVQLEKAGADLIDISGGISGYTNPEFKGQGYFKDISHAVKQKIKLPVILTGGVTDPAAAEALLNDGDADLIGVGRAILKDSLWPKKAMSK